MTKPIVVVFDTTEITRDPMCSGTAWQILAHRRPAWRVRVITTEVVVEEAVANYGRALDPALEMINKFEERFGRRLGLSSIANEGRSKITTGRDSYSEKLRTLLNDASVDVVPPTKTSHMDIVRRATTRRRPCNSNGDGYRDTLNWLTLISLARRNPKSDVVWVTGNIKDFQAEDGTDFHKDLSDDLHDAGVTNVRLLTSLQELAVELVTNLGAADNSDLASARAALQKDVLAKYIANEVMIDSKSRELKAADCGLPYGIRHAQIDKITSVDNIEVTVIGQSADDASLATFSAMVAADISGEISNTRDLSAFTTTDEVDPDTGLVRGSMHKSLAVEGIITVGNYGSPKNSEIKSIEAQPGDNGLTIYKEEQRKSRNQSSTTRSFSSAATFSAMQESIAANYPSAALQNIITGLSSQSAIQRAYTESNPTAALQSALKALNEQSSLQKLYEPNSLLGVLQKAVSALNSSSLADVKNGNTEPSYPPLHPIEKDKQDET